MANNNEARRAQPIVSDTPARAHDSGPLYFGPPNRPLFGWLHCAAPPDTDAVGLIVCNPFGNEAVCAHRTIRQLCERASSAGIPALRFDYDGTGDSAGHDATPGRIEAWVESVGLAADEMKRCTGLERVCLFGIRLGAALAALAAARRADVAALIAFAPVVSGKAYLRELRILQRAMDAKRALVRGATDTTLETAGFVLTAETQAKLTEIDLNKLEGTPAPSILLLDRAELQGDTRWSKRLQERGARVDHLSITGYTDMMLDSHESVVPEKMIETTLDWLSRCNSEQPPRTRTNSRTPATAPPQQQHQAIERATFTYTEPYDPIIGAAANIAVDERAVRFGGPAALFGIVSVARMTAAPHGTGHGKAVVLLNSGAVHHIGPNRLHVSLARHLARQGYTVLRMDIAGIGDSPARPGEPENVVYSAHALQDIGAALAYLRGSWHVKEITAVGLCSGAYNAFKAAVAHLALDAVILINPLTFFWKEGSSLRYPEYRVAADIMRYRTNALRLGPWLKLLRGRVNLWELSQVLARASWRTASQILRTVARAVRIPLKDDLPTELRSIVHGGIRLNFVFAEREPGLELLSTQGGALARRLHNQGRLGLQTVPGADHTFTDRDCRTMLVAALDTALSEKHQHEPTV